MYISDAVKYIGVNDHRVDLFEGQYKVPNGMSYNSYVILDEKAAVMDTVDQNFTEEWLSHAAEALDGRKPDYLVVQHMEPDHSANIANFLKVYPDTTLVGNKKTMSMIDNYFTLDSSVKRLVVGNGESLSLGSHVLTFVFAPMVHWPEVMVTYERSEKILFSADGFGKFGALDIEEPWDDEAARYFIGIVGKFGAQVQNLLKAASTLEIEKICPLHGPVLTENLGHYLSLYDTWSSYRPEKQGVVVAYTSVYGNTRKAAELLAEKLKAHGTAVEIYDLARDDMSKAVAAAFRCDRLVLASTTYNGGVYPFMHDFITRLSEHNFRQRQVGIIENGSWASMAGKVMRELLKDCKELTFTENTVKIMAAVKEENLQQLDAMAEELCRC